MMLSFLVTSCPGIFTSMRAGVSLISIEVTVVGISLVSR